MTPVATGTKAPQADDALSASPFSSSWECPLGLQEQELAFLFLDIRDFTPLMASRPARQVIFLLRKLFKLFRESIEGQGGTLIETTGDGLYAVFGLEERFSVATESAVEAGFAILERLQERNQTYFWPLFGHWFQVGIGVHVGQALVGYLGLSGSATLTVMGHPVNIAARLQAATKQVNNSFIISQQAYHLLSVPPVGTSKRISLKGIQGQLQVHLLGTPYSDAIPQPGNWKAAS